MLKLDELVSIAKVYFKLKNDYRAWHMIYLFRCRLLRNENHVSETEITQEYSFIGFPHGIDTNTVSPIDNLCNI